MIAPTVNELQARLTEKREEIAEAMAAYDAAEDGVEAGKAREHVWKLEAEATQLERDLYDAA